MPAVFPKVLCGLHTVRGAPGTRISLPIGKGSELQRAAGRWERFNPAAVQSQHSEGQISEDTRWEHRSCSRNEFQVSPWPGRNEGSRNELRGAWIKPGSSSSGPPCFH